LPDTLLAEKHKELLTVGRKIKKTRQGEVIEEIEELDTNAIKSGLDMGYKLKGHYAPEKHKIEAEIEAKEGEFHPEDEELRLEYKKKLLENIQKRAKDKENGKNNN